nr:aminotransferase class I/II-fold pyridoxal phosphate-dependent enzyme [Asaia platycodi]
MIVDEAYIEYAPRARSAVALIRSGANVAVFRTLNKIYGLAGLPIGYLVAPPSLVHAFQEAGFGDAHGIGRLPIATARAALADQAWVAQVRT